MSKDLPARKPAIELLNEFLTHNQIVIYIQPPDFGVSPQGFLVATSESTLMPKYKDELPKEDDATSH